MYGVVTPPALLSARSEARVRKKSISRLLLLAAAGNHSCVDSFFAHPRRIIHIFTPPPTPDGFIYA